MIIGRLTRDPELRTTPGGANVCQLSVATNYVYTNQQSGQKVEQVEYHNIVLWRKLADIANQYLKKGTQVFIEGRLQTRSWDAKDGQKKNRTEIVGDNMIMLAKSMGSGQGNSQSSSSPSSSPASSSTLHPSNNSFSQPSSATSFASDSGAVEELPTIQQGEDIDVSEIPF